MATIRPVGDRILLKQHKAEETYGNTNIYVPDSHKEKEDMIIEEIGLEESPEDGAIRHAIDTCKNLYETPTYRAYKGIKSMLDRLARYMETTAIDHGRDGNLTALVNTAAKFDQIRQSFKGAYTDMKNEQQSSVRGGQGLAYDQL